jgi:hypothetical protein
MPAPVVHWFTQRVYDSLPEALRSPDGDLGWPLLRYLALVLDQAGEFADTAAAIDYVPLDEGGAAGDVSLLVDPDNAPASWLPWMAQLVGVRLDPALSEAARRDAIRFAPAGWRAGSRGALADAARSALTGTRNVRVYDHTDAGSDLGAAGMWHVAVATLAAETPSAQAVLDAINAQHAVPAGVWLHHRPYTASWAQIQSAHPTWATRNGLTWTQLQETGS